MIKHITICLGLAFFFGVNSDTFILNKTMAVDAGKTTQSNTVLTGCASGNIYQDLSSDGVNNAEPGIDQIEVNIYDCDNNQVGTTTSDATGDWQICGLSDNTMYRIELSLTAIQTDMYKNSLSGSDNGTNVQFGETNEDIDFGLVKLENAAFIITPCYNYAGYQGTFATNEALVGLPINEISDPNTDATTQIIKYASHEEIGTTYGVAIHQNSKKAYTEQSRDRDDICCAKGGSVIYIYALDPSTGIWTLVLEEDVQRAGLPGITNFFIHWTDEYKGDFSDKSQIVLSDIEFDGDDLIVGLEEISGDKLGNEKGPPIAADSTALFFSSVAGDILRFCYDTNTSSFNFENNGTCGGQTSAGANSGYGWPESSTPRGSYYTGDFFSTSHPQTSLGGLWKNPEDNRLYSTVYELTAVFQSGIKSLDNTTGLTEEIYIIIPDTRANGAFGKSVSLGDLESFADVRP